MQRFVCINVCVGEGEKGYIFWIYVYVHLTAAGGGQILATMELWKSAVGEGERESAGLADVLMILLGEFKYLLSLSSIHSLSPILFLSLPHTNLFTQLPIASAKLDLWKKWARSKVSPLFNHSLKDFNNLNDFCNRLFLTSLSALSCFTL